MGELIQLKRPCGRPRLHPHALIHENQSRCACGASKPPLARACINCSWFDPAIFNRLDMLTGTTRKARQQIRRAEYLLGNGKEDQFTAEFLRS